MPRRKKQDFEVASDEAEEVNEELYELENAPINHSEE